MSYYRLADHEVCALSYSGSKARLTHALARLRVWEFDEYRESFIGGGSMFFHLRRVAPCQRYWLNDIDPLVVNFHRHLRDDADVLIDRLRDIFADHGGGTQKLFDLRAHWEEKGDALEKAVAIFLRGLIVRGTEQSGFGFAKTRAEKGKALTHSKIIRLQGFAELLQGAKITNLDYRKVLTAPGKRVFIFSDPPYEGVGERLYRFGKFDLPAFAAAIDACQHSVMWTLNASDNTRAAFAHHNVIQHKVQHTIGGNKKGDEIIGTNYTTPLFEVHAREIGTLLTKVPVESKISLEPMVVPAAANENIEHEVPAEEDQAVTIHHQSCEDMGGLPDGAVHLTVTSPPYYNARAYSQYEDYAAYLAFMKKVFGEVHRVTAEGRFMVVISSPVIEPRLSRATSSIRHPVPFDLHSLATSAGWEFIDDIIWVKPGGAAKDRNSTFRSGRKPLTYKPNPVTEYAMVYRKKTERLIDWNLKQYQADVMTASRVAGDVERTNVWKISPASNAVHDAVYPVELAQRFIELYSMKGDMVLDPFMGSGTTAVAALQAGRQSVGYEIHAKYIGEAQRRIAEAQNAVQKNAA